MFIMGKSVPNISCKKCKHRHPAELTCGEAAAIAKANGWKPQEPKPAAKKPDVWATLYERINAYTDAAIGESWKGGGDPNDVEVHELRLKLTQVELSNHIERMKAELA